MNLLFLYQGKQRCICSHGKYKHVKQAHFTEINDVFFYTYYCNNCNCINYKEDKSLYV